MISKNLGKVRIDWKGQWSTTSKYRQLDAVKFNGSSYIALVDITEVTPPDKSTQWDILALAGTQGKDGKNGRDGQDGKDGPQGPEGPQGVPGRNGDAATIEIGNVIPGDRAEVINVGTRLNAVFDFRLPKGDKGDQGPAGEQGISPHVDYTTGNWFVGDKDTGYSASGNVMVNVGTSTELPPIGNKNFIYVVGDTFDSFVWDDVSGTYKQLNTVTINTITCGDSNNG